MQGLDGFEEELHYIFILSLLHGERSQFQICHLLDMLLRILLFLQLINTRFYG